MSIIYYINIVLYSQNIVKVISFNKLYYKYLVEISSLNNYSCWNSKKKKIKTDSLYKFNLFEVILKTGGQKLFQVPTRYNFLSETS